MPTPPHCPVHAFSASLLCPQALCASFSLSINTLSASNKSSMLSVIPNPTFKSYTVLSPASWSSVDMHRVLPLNREKLGPWHPPIIPSTKVLTCFPQDPTQLPTAPSTHLLTTQALHTSQILLFWLTTFFRPGQRSS